MNRPCAEGDSEIAIEGCGRAAAEEMPQHHGAGFLAGQFLQLLRDGFANAPQAFDPAGLVSLHGYLAADRLGPFGHHDNRIGLAILVLAFEMGGDLLDRIGDLRNEDGVGPAGDPGMKRNPSTYRPITSTTRMRS